MKDYPQKIRLKPDAALKFAWELDHMIEGKISLEQEFPEIAEILDLYGWAEVCDSNGKLIYTVKQ